MTDRIAPYTLELTLDEAQSLRWLADRYNYAECLWKNTDPDEQSPPVYIVSLTEPDAWAFRDAVQAEDGYLPCCGDELRDKITALLESIV